MNLEDREIRCSKCREIKPVSEFYLAIKAGPKRFGRDSWCKTCTRLRVKANYWRNREVILERKRRYNQTPEGRLVAIRNMKRMRIKYKDRLRARSAIQEAIRKGTLVRQPCEVCKATKSEAHHHKGYEKENYLEVRWLCLIHHRGEHYRASA